ncbi:MAG: hypothetical protein Q9181_008366, partial [Wetmoreana brouardii]
EGEMIRVEIKGLGGGGEMRRKEHDEEGKLFAIKPPPPPLGGGTEGGGGEKGISFLPPPPSARDIKAETRRSRGGLAPVPEKGSAKELGFDDGEFGEFQ